MESAGSASHPAPASARARLADDVHQQLLGRLLSHQLQPGQRLTVDALARELGVSQTPIREALHRLEVGGVVVRTHLAGYRVAPQLTRQQFDDLVEVRLLLEPAAARRAAEHMADDDIERLAALAASMTAPLADTEASGESGYARESAEREPGGGGAVDDSTGRGYAAFASRDAAFHDAVAIGSDNQVLRDALARLHVHVQLFRLGAGARIRVDALEEHAAVVAAIRAHEPGAAERAMRRHVERSAARFAETFGVR
jgi:DNA-binding GntR family transcriptional regulator